MSLKYDAFSTTQAVIVPITALMVNKNNDPKPHARHNVRERTIFLNWNNLVNSEILHWLYYSL